ncbi:MAG: alpha/beta hydrolase [Actinomycetota bacterium]|nr:alpha/beta hydrolase [Actinomycetota bacterium]
MAEIVANGIRLEYDVIGEGDPLLLVAGRGMPRSWWTEEHVRPYLDAGYRVILFDNRGMPPSDCPEEPFTIADLVSDTAALIDGLDLGRSVVVGYSMGSCIAQELAVVRPDLVRAVALVATLARHPGWLDAFHRGALELFATAVSVPAEFWVAMLIGQVYTPDELANDDAVLPTLEALVAGPQWEDPGRRGQWAAYAAYEGRVSELSRVEAPSLVIAFERDLIMPPVRAREVADAIPNCRYVEVARVGHWGLLLQPRDVHATVLRFLDGAMR